MNLRKVIQYRHTQSLRIFTDSINSIFLSDTALLQMIFEISDYAVQIFHDAMTTRKFDCYLRRDTRLPMIYIDDCLRSVIEYLNVPEEKLKLRTYNITAMSFTPEELVEEVKKYVPKLQVSYNPDSRQEIGKPC